MDNSKIDSNIKQILDLRSNKGVFPLSSESAIITHSPSGEMTYLDSVIDYLYQQITHKIRLYTEQDGNNTKGKAYPAAMGLRDSSNITSLQNNINNYTSLLNSLQQQINNIDQTDAISSLNTTVSQLQEEFNSLMAASEYSYQEIKFSDSITRPTSNLDDSTYWKDTPLTNFEHLWLGIRTVTVRKGQNGEAIVTTGPAMIVSLQGPKGEKGDRGEQGPPGVTGTAGQNGDSYRPVLMYKWTDSRTTVPTTPTEPLNQNWAENPGTPEGNNKYLWMTQNYRKMSDNTYINQNWSTPVCLSGEDGVGADGAGIEFIFYRTNNKDFVPSVASINAYNTGTTEQHNQFQSSNFPFIGTDEANIISGNLWTDNPRGIELNAKYEWASFRESSEGEWGNFCTPFRWSVWGEDGIDGDGVEYIYYLSDVLKNETWLAVAINAADDTDPRTWSRDANFQNSGYIRANTNWHNDPTGVSIDYPYEYVSTRKRDGINKVWSSYSRPVLWAKYGKDGVTASAGLNGAVVRFRGEYTPSTQYVNESLDINKSATAIRYIDVVMVTALDETSYYMVKPLLDDTRSTTISPTDPNQNDWQEATGYSFIAAEALYAQDAHINDLSTYEFVVQDSENNIVAGMTGYNVDNSVVSSSNNNDSNPVRIWAGSSATDNINLQNDNIPFKVFQNGKLKATNAEIKGDLSVDSLLLTGSQGSYYYNLSNLTLPKVDGNKHRVIFIITAETGTNVTAHSGDVLFAFYNNSMQTTNSTTLSTYKIYLAISINNGQSSGWLLQNLNALELQTSIGYYSCNIVEGPMQQGTIYGDVHDDQLKLYLRRDLGNICSFTTANTSSYQNATLPQFYIEGNIDFETTTGDHITTLHLSSISASSISGLGSSTFTGNVTMGNIIDIYDGHENDYPKSIYLDGTGWTVDIYRNSNNHTQDYIEISIPLREGIDNATPIKVIPSISLTESFNYSITTNHTSLTTTTVVGSNGFVIKDGSIVATSMPEGAFVNMKDCIVYKDVTEEQSNNEQYEVTNFGTSPVTIGNTTLNPNSTILVKATPNTQIDFSDITTINNSDIQEYTYPGNN